MHSIMRNQIFSCFLFLSIFLLIRSKEVLNFKEMIKREISDATYIIIILYYELED